jgi:hypothetical protein
MCKYCGNNNCITSSGKKCDILIKESSNFVQVDENSFYFGSIEQMMNYIKYIPELKKEDLLLRLKNTNEKFVLNPIKEIL